MYLKTIQTIKQATQTTDESRYMEAINYFWYCKICGIPNRPAASMEDARGQLEAHEKEVHKGKFVGGFGFDKVEKNNVILLQ